MMTVTVERDPEPEPRRSSSGTAVPDAPGTTHAWLAYEEAHAAARGLQVPGDQLSGRTLTDLANGGHG